MSGRNRSALITLLRQTRGTDEYNEAIDVWSPFASEWAQVFYGRGSERRQAAAEQGQQTATFQVLSNELTRTVRLLDRLALDGFMWDIAGISPDTPRRGRTEITANATFEQYEAPADDAGVLDFSDPANSGLLALFLDDMGWPAPVGDGGTMDFSDPAQSGLATLVMEDA